MPVASEPAEGEWRSLAEGEWRSLSEAIGAVIGGLSPEGTVSAGSATR
jgi:hypothetical protein